MLKHRIIPILLYDGAFCVITEQFKRPARRIGPINQYVNNLANRDIDELVLLDIERKTPDFNKIKSFTEKLFCPVSYGGSVNSLDGIKRLIQDCGVDKVVIKTGYKIIYDAARVFGSQAITYAADIELIDGRFSIPGCKDWYERIYCVENSGAGEIMLTGINKQGKMNGYELDLYSEVSQVCNLPLIANGGCGNPDHMIEAIKAGADAVAVGTALALRSVTPQDCARALLRAGLPSRVEVTG